MAVWENFVQVSLANSYDDTATSMVFNAASGPWKNPPNPSGEVAYCTLVDDISAPTKFEIISYTLINGFGPFTMSGITRGVEGTTAQSWTAGSYIVQYLTVAQTVDTDELASLTGDVVINGGTF